MRVSKRKIDRMIRKSVRRQYKDEGEAAALIGAVFTGLLLAGVLVITNKFLKISRENQFKRNVQSGVWSEEYLVGQMAVEYARIIKKGIFELNLYYSKTKDPQYLVSIKRLEMASKQLMYCKTFKELKVLMTPILNQEGMNDLNKLHADYLKALNEKKLDRAIKHKDFDTEAIQEKIRQQCNMLLGEVRRQARRNPEFSKLLASVIGMSAFWDALNGVKDVGNAAYKTFKKLFTRIEKQYERYYNKDVIISNLIRGIGRLGLAFFKVKVSSKIIAFSQGY